MTKTETLLDERSRLCAEQVFLERHGATRRDERRKVYIAKRLSRIENRLADIAWTKAR